MQFLVDGERVVGAVWVGGGGGASAPGITQIRNFTYLPRDGATKYAPVVINFTRMLNA